VVNLSSDAGIQGNAGAAVYCASKGAVSILTKALALELAPRGIRVNAVSPGPIFFEGGVWDQIRKHQPDLFNRAAQMSALGRHGRPEEVADAITFLASPRAGFITGANLRIDGAMVKTVNH
jgi:3-oxoacyl-[acyl-carrier protein] reductase